MPVLLDQFGREITVAKRPETRALAVAAVRDRWSTYPSSGLTPVRLAAIFKEADAGDIYRQAELFEEMEEKDTHLFSQLQTRKNSVLGLSCEITPASESAADKMIADFVTEVFAALPDLDETLLDLLDAVGKGWSLCEIMWALDGRRTVISGFEHIHAKRAVFYEMSNGPWDPLLKVPRVITAQNEIEGQELPAFKAVYHKYKARSGYDTRAGVLRVCAWMYLFKNYAIKDWVAFAEIFGMPLRLGKYDPGAGTDDKDALVAAISSLGSDAAGIISKNTEIEFIETVKNTGSNNLYEQLGVFCNAEMSKAILGQTLTSQEGQSGSYSLGQVHDLVRHDLTRADAKALAKTLQFQVVRPLVGYNFGWDAPLPAVAFPFDEPEDLKSLSEVYKNLSEINYPLTVEHVAERFKVPLPGEGQTVLAARMPDTGPPIAAKRGASAAPGAKFDPRQEKVEGLVAGSLDRANLALTGVLAPVERLILKAGSLEELRDGIYAAYDGMDAAALEELIARAMYAAELYGRLTAAD